MPLTLPQPLRCNTTPMRAVWILLAAVMLGLAGGYAWSALQPKPHGHVPKGVTPKLVEAPETLSDSEWDARPADTAPLAVETDRPDPTAVEQSVHYSGCNEVRAAGKAPLHVGEPGYSAEMDGDGDGIACEPHKSRG